ncbi:MAG: toprim domain-containing protein [Burkholderiales bacterium]|nr:toprim domain-containing protein [Burkholderiales bacterium]
MADPVQAFRAAILAALGHAPDDIEPGRFHRFATSDRRGDDAGWCRLFADMRGGVFGCNRLGMSETWSAADRTTLTHQQRTELARQVAQAAAEREREQRQQWQENGRRIARIWAQCLPLVAGDPVTLYLKHRGFGGVWPLPECMRYHRALDCWEGRDRIGMPPAMVAPLMSPEGRMVALHRTYLTADGRKAQVPTVKKLTGAAGSLAGACIPLHKPIRGVIGIAEGIETALAAWCASTVPTVAAYCAGNLAAWQWPRGVHRIVVFADHDTAGREAAQALHDRARAAGLTVQVLTPDEPGDDWADVWASGRNIQKVSA